MNTFLLFYMTGIILSQFLMNDDVEKRLQTTLSLRKLPSKDSSSRHGRFPFVKINVQLSSEGKLPNAAFRKAQLPHRHCFPLGRAKRVLRLGHFTRRLILEVLLGKKFKKKRCYLHVVI